MTTPHFEKSREEPPGRRRRFQEASPSDAGRTKRRSRWGEIKGEEDSRPHSAPATVTHEGEVGDPPVADLDDESLANLVGGGTWEHRRRAKEMMRTADLSAAITAVSNNTKDITKGAGIGGFLPTQVAAALDRRLNTAGEEASDADPMTAATAGKSIASSSKGYKMLQMAGWHEGQGLGKDGSGISAPVPTVEKTVFQETASSAQGGAADPFEQYRKRMMLAYRFRPNPMNNPRRSYDGYQTLYDPKMMNRVMGTVEDANKHNLQSD